MSSDVLAQRGAQRGGHRDVHRPDQRASLTGRISSAGEPLEFATVMLKGTSTGVTTNNRGEYRLDVAPGAYTLVVRSLGYVTLEKALTLSGRQTLDIVMETEDKALDEVFVFGKSVAQQVNESAFNVVAINAKAFHNTTLDLAHALDRISGARIREAGGVGSQAEFSLNGFSGRHVKFFLDGVPMEGFGSSFQINNIPVNMAERIEVYKGVVPVSFGSDALGGAVNIVTGQQGRSFVDASYSYGSFNTHRSYVNAGYTADNGFTVHLNIFQNYSDNDYWIYTPVLDLATLVFSPDEKRVRRFHDTYHNETLIAGIGVVGKRFADRLMLGVTIGADRGDIQNSNIQKVVFGERYRRGQTIMPSVRYAKKNLFVDGLDANLTGNINLGYSQNVDTAARQYNWYGKWRETSRKGEVNYSVAKYYNNNASLTANITYKPSPGHSLALNNVTTTFDRTSRNTVAMSGSINATDTFPKVTVKNVTGLSYKLDFDDRLNLSVFGKHYVQYTKGPRNVSTATNSYNYELFANTFSTTGYGAAATYMIRDMQLKASYEKTYRLPTANELFGNEDLEKSNAVLNPENSDNVNVNIGYNHIFDRKHSIFVDAGFMYRDIKDYIRRVVESMHNTAAYENHGHVRNTGYTGEVRYSYGRLLTLGGNFTYQDLRNKEKYRSPGSTVISTSYDSRVPNVPYIYGNGDLSLFLSGVGGRHNSLNIGYSALYVYRFPLRWGTNGAYDSKDMIPTQFSHDVSLTYSVMNGRYSISLECRNLTDERLYDNFSLQKPGRSFSAKVRYFFSK
ncbi:MAG: carboxypeptidase-like regulatory domain-containing protein [Tannerellaceae bacterium]|jgi:outer membrane receptor protein involved in Fe transport|nr:carboxypeptidase-like regulatory domain-containing protein [Tannerellaceae bacterium]